MNAQQTFIIIITSVLIITLIAHGIRNIKDWLESLRKTKRDVIYFKMKIQDLEQDLKNIQDAFSFVLCNAAIPKYKKGEQIKYAIILDVEEDVIGGYFIGFKYKLWNKHTFEEMWVTGKELEATILKINKSEENKKEEAKKNN